MKLLKVDVSMVSTLPFPVVSIPRESEQLKEVIIPPKTNVDVERYEEAWMNTAPP